MATLLRKSLALVSATALVLSNASSLLGTASAANLTTVAVNGGSIINATTQVTTVSFTPVTALTNGSVVYVTYPSTYTDTGLVFGDIDVANGATDLTEGVITVDTTANLITIPVTTVTTGTSPVTLTFSNSHLASATAEVATFAVSTSVGDRGVVAVSTASANVVAVSATVLPSLSMALVTTNANLGILSSSAVTDSAGQTAVTVSTNAGAGYSLSASATTSDATNMPLASRNALGTPGTPGFGVFVGSVSDAANGGVLTSVAGFNSTTAATAINGTPAAIASSTGPANGDVVNVKYAGGISALTPAGAYTLTTTYTISGSF